MSRRSLAEPRVSTLPGALALTLMASTVACGDDTSPRGDGSGGSASNASVTAASSGSTANSTSGSGQGGSGGDGTGGSGTGGLGTGGSGTGGSGTGGSGTGGSGTGGSGTGGSGTGGGASICGNDNDGEVRRDEVPLEVGYSATFLASTTTSFSSQGVTQNGQLTWDFDVDLDGDELIVSEAVDPTRQWFGASYPDATYAKLDEAGLRLTSEDIWVVFQATSDALLMVGLASLDGGSGRTELTFDPPVIVFDFPLAEGKTWSTTTTVTGLLQGISVSYAETHEHEVDASGIAGTPSGALEVLRVRSDLTRTIFPTTTTRRTFDFVAECFGTAARIVSQENEAAEEFDEPSRVLRLSP